MSHPFRASRFGDDYDGTRVEHVLDYYFPEWRSNATRMPMEFAEGRDISNRRIKVHLISNRKFIVRLTNFKGSKFFVELAVRVESPKETISHLWKYGDSYDKKTDTRFLIMKKDWEKK